MRTLEITVAHDLVFPAMCCSLRTGAKELFLHLKPPVHYRRGDRVVIIETRDGVPTDRKIRGVITSVDQESVPADKERASSCEFPSLRSIYETGLAEVRFGRIETRGFSLKPPVNYESMRSDYLANAGRGVL